MTLDASMFAGLVGPMMTLMLWVGYAQQNGCQKGIKPLIAQLRIDNRARAILTSYCGASIPVLAGLLTG